MPFLYSECFLSLGHYSPKNHTQSRKKNDLGKPKMHEISALGPIDPTSVPEDEEEEKAAPWIMRTLVGVSSDFFNTQGSCTPVGRQNTDRERESAIHWGQMNSLHATKLPASHVFRRPHPPQFQNMIIPLFNKTILS